MTRWITPTTLTSELVTLEPMKLEHEQDLLAAASDGNLWELWYTSVPSAGSIAEYVSVAMENMQNSREFPFVVRHNPSGKIIGSTRFCNVDHLNHRMEIGYTWYSKSFQRTAVNTQTKLLLLGHAFETLGAIAVEFRTHWFNQASRNAILKLGAKQDGVLRNHQQMEDGSCRDTVVFSIIQSEWLSTKRHLQSRLRQGFLES